MPTHQTGILRGVPLLRSKLLHERVQVISPGRDVLNQGMTHENGQIAQAAAGYFDGCGAVKSPLKHRGLCQNLLQMRGQGSPAIDAGSGADTTDQRGVFRPQAFAVDIGAFELEWTPSQLYLPMILR
jgi:hypothetical protein